MHASIYSISDDCVRGSTPLLCGYNNDQGRRDLTLTGCDPFTAMLYLFCFGFHVVRNSSLKSNLQMGKS